MISVSWEALKSICSSRSLGMQFVEDSYRYLIFAVDGPIVFAFDMIKADPATIEQADFETNFKANANKKIEPTDSEGAHLNRSIYNPPGWHFEPRCIKMTTGKYKSSHSKKFDAYNINDLSDVGDVTQKFFESDGTELVKGETESDEEFQSRLDSDCTCTIVDWWPNYDCELISALFSVKNPPDTTQNQACYAWCIIAPDIPAAYGGSVPFVQGGMDLSFAADKCCVKIDGRCSKRLNNDRIYATNKIRFALVHTIGLKTSFKVLMEYYKE